MNFDNGDWKATVKRYLDQYEQDHRRLSTRLTHFVGIPMIVASIPVVLVNPLVAAGLFVGGWALQLIGHYVFEKNSPSFYGDPVYLLVGPVWVVVEILQLLGLPLPDYLTPGSDEVTVSPMNGAAASHSAPSPTAN